MSTRRSIASIVGLKSPLTAEHPAGFAPSGGGRTWWAHLEFTRINMTPTIPRKKIEDLRALHASRAVPRRSGILQRTAAIVQFCSRRSRVSFHPCVRCNAVMTLPFVSCTLPRIGGTRPLCCLNPAEPSSCQQQNGDHDIRGHADPSARPTQKRRVSARQPGPCTSPFPTIRPEAGRPKPASRKRRRKATIQRQSGECRQPRCRRGRPEWLCETVDRENRGVARTQENPAGERRHAPTARPREEPSPPSLIQFSRGVGVLEGYRRTSEIVSNTCR